MYIPILSSFSTRSGERAFASGDERKKGERVRKTGRKGEGTGVRRPRAVHRRSSRPTQRHTPTDRPHRSSHKRITYMGQLGRFRNYASSIVGRIVIGSWQSALHARVCPAGRSAHHFSPYQSHTFEYVQTNRKEGRKEGRVDTTRAVRSAPACHLRLCIFYPRGTQRAQRIGAFPAEKRDDRRT